jgi:hypothetical protein
MNDVARRRALNGRCADGLVERDETAPMLHRKGKKVMIGDLLRSQERVPHENLGAGRVDIVRPAAVASGVPKNESKSVYNTTKWVISGLA